MEALNYTTQPDVTLDDFAVFLDLPDNADRRFELISGEIVEKMESNLVSSNIASIVSLYIGIYLLQNPIGRLTGEAGAYRVGDNVYIPDVAFVSKSRLPELSYAGFGPIAPDLAVEVLSKTDRPKDIRFKVVNYLAAGTVVWVVDPEAQTVEVYTPNQPAQLLHITDTLTGGDFLPDFSLPVQTIFPEARTTPPTE